MLRWRPTFTYGTEGLETSLELSLPVGLWRHGVLTRGGRRLTGTGVPGAARTGRRDTLVLPLRFLESEWPEVAAWLVWAQTKAPFTWLLDTEATGAGQLESADVWLDAPQVGEVVAPQPDPGYPRVLLLEVVLRRVDGGAWDLEYFPAAEDEA